MSPGEHAELVSELGLRAATLLANEAEGWGPWVNTSRMWGIDRSIAVALHQDWLPSAHPAEWRAGALPQQRRP